MNVSCGASNISFGMPDRPGIDAAFLTMADPERHEHRHHEPAARRRCARRRWRPTCCWVATPSAPRGSRGTAQLVGRRSGTLDRAGEGRGHVSAQRHDVARPRRHHPVQRRALGRPADRVHVRRARHVRQVRRRRSWRARPKRPPADHRHLADRLDDGWRLSCQCPVGGRHGGRGAAAHAHAEGRHDGRGPVRAAGAQRREAVLRARRALAGRITARTSRGCWTPSRRRGTRASYDPGILPRLALGDARRHRAHGDAGRRPRRRRGGAATRPRGCSGVSFDIGTTTCVATLVDLRSGATVGVASTLNQQAPFGADVIARMARAMSEPDDIGTSARRRARHRERAHRPRCVRRPRWTPRRSTRRWSWATPPCCTCCAACTRSRSRSRPTSPRSRSRRTCAPTTPGSTSTRAAAWRCSPRSAPTWARTSSGDIVATGLVRDPRGAAAGRRGHERRDRVRLP